jgi:hypothetical protein
MKAKSVELLDVRGITTKSSTETRNLSISWGDMLKTNVTLPFHPRRTYNKPKTLEIATSR